jgi:hypothetical protein
LLPNRLLNLALGAANRSRISDLEETIFEKFDADGVEWLKDELLGIKS